MSALERYQQVSVTLPEARERAPDYNANATSRLVKKGALQRLAPGVFVAVPFEALGRPWTVSAAAAVATVLAKEPYVLGGFWAFTHHRLTSQQHGSQLDVFVQTRRKTRVLGDARVTFHPDPALELSWGTLRAHIDGVEVVLPDPERTLLDTIRFPKLLGSLRSLTGLFPATLPKVDAKKLQQYAARHATPRACQRLGVLLERAGIAGSSALHKKAGQTRSVLSMLPGEPRTGGLNTRWRVVENDL